MKEIYLAGGCFWGTQAYYQKIKGVISTEVGHANGPGKTNYEMVCNGSGHVEVVKIVYDEKILLDQELFDSYIHIVEPFNLNKQGNDVGVQYRIGLYTNDLDLLSNLKAMLATWEAKHGKSEIEVLKLQNYQVAEKYHQDYLLKNPTGYCHINLNDIPRALKK